jgi:hypothetical protein
MTLSDAMANAIFKHNGGASTFSPTQGFDWGVDAFGPRLGNTDLSHMYRQWRNSAEDEYSQQALIHPNGVLSDMSGNFGDKFLSGHMQRLGSLTLRIIKSMVLEVLRTWQVWRPPPAAHTQLAGAWDNHPIVLKWRDVRYTQARNNGLSETEAIDETNPLTMKQYIDDAMNGFIELFISVIIPTIFKFADIINLDMSKHKTQLAAPGPRLRTMNKAGEWSEPLPLHSISLGKVYDLDLRNVRDTPARIEQVGSLVRQMKQQALILNKPLAEFALQEQAVGIVQFVGQTEPAIRGLSQAPIRSLTVRTALKTRSTRQARVCWRPSG